MRPKLGLEGSEAFQEMMSDRQNVKLLETVLAHYVYKMGEEVLKLSLGHGDEAKSRELLYKKSRYEGATELYKRVMEEISIRQKGGGDQRIE